MIYEYIFWIMISVILYNYVGYMIVLIIIVSIKNLFSKKKLEKDDIFPEVTLIIPAYNEIEFVEAKIENTNQLNYPKDKLKVLWVTDGSDDGTTQRLKKEPGITVLHKKERTGKIGAVNRAMKFVTTPFVVFCDANSILNKDCLIEILKPFKDPKIGCVAGEKKIRSSKRDKAVGTGEGIYWNYESIIKKLESKVNSTVGAAGELFALRTELYEQIPENSIIEDFVISLMVISKSYKTSYSEKAFSEETPSLNIREELKRKVRIAYGSIQTFFSYFNLMNPFKYGFFSFQYFSHKVLRWTFVPVFIPLVFLLNILIYLEPRHVFIYDYILLFQGIFYFLAFLGMLFKEKKLAIRIFFLPFYMLVMNFAIIKGYFRFFSSKQSVAWEKVKRS